MEADRVTVKVAGQLSGVVYMPSLDSNVGDLRQEIANLMGTQPVSLKLLLAGRHLQDDQKTLAAAGVTPTSKVLVIGCGSEARTEMAAVEAKQQQLAKIKCVLESMSKRDAQTDDNALELYNQSNQKVPLKVEDKQAIIAGLTLHDRGKAFMSKDAYPEALEALLMAEESFNLASPELLQMIDNYGLLLLDTVWCCYKLQDVRRLGVAQRKLQGARSALAAAHGPNLERVRRIHGTGFCPEIATYLRLEVLEGVVAYHVGDYQEAEKDLSRASNKWKSLQVSDEQLALLQEMGHGMKESMRALRFSGGSITAALDFIQNQRAQEQEKKKQQKEEAEWHKERRAYGKTSAGLYIDRESHKRLVEGLGYDSMLAGEALRSKDNDFNAALDALVDPRKLAAVTLAGSLKLATAATESECAKGSAPHKRCQGDGAGASGAACGQGAGASGDDLSNTGSEEQAQAGSMHGGRSGNEEMQAMGREQAEGQGGMEGEAVAGQGGGEELEVEVDENAAEMQRVEDDLVGDLQSDAMAAYDIDVAEEGSIIETYKVLCSTAAAAR